MPTTTPQDGESKTSCTSAKPWRPSADYLSLTIRFFVDLASSLSQCQMIASTVYTQRDREKVSPHAWTLSARDMAGRQT